jgi:hypothetical protein
VLSEIAIGPVLPGRIGQTSLNTNVAKNIVAQAEQSAEAVADAPGRLLAFGHVAQAAATVKDNDAVLRAVGLGFPIGSQLLIDAKARGSMHREVVIFWLHHMVKVPRQRRSAIRIDYCPGCHRCETSRPVSDRGRRAFARRTGARSLVILAAV